MKHILHLIFFSSFLISNSTYGQKFVRWDVGAGVIGATPSGTFKDRTDDHDAYGLNLFGYYSLNPDRPVLLGLNLDVLLSSTRKTEYDVTDVNGTTYPVDEILTNWIFRPTARIKYPFLKFGRFTPYVEGQVGINWMFSISSLTDDELDEQIESITEVSDIAMTYGAGFGIEYNIRELLAIVGRVDYTIGNSVDYLALDKEIDRDSVQYPVELYRKVESSANMLIFAIGIIARL